MSKKKDIVHLIYINNPSVINSRVKTPTAAWRWSYLIKIHTLDLKINFGNIALKQLFKYMRCGAKGAVFTPGEKKNQLM